MILIIDNGESYSDRAIEFVDIGSHDVAEIGPLVAKAVGPDGAVLGCAAGALRLYLVAHTPKEGTMTLPPCPRCGAAGVVAPPDVQEALGRELACSVCFGVYDPPLAAARRAESAEGAATRYRAALEALVEEYRGCAQDVGRGAAAERFLSAIGIPELLGRS